jgi:hypothetical protein
MRVIAMFKKKLFILITTALLAFPAAVVLIQFQAIPTKNLTAGMLLYPFIGLLAAGFLMRLAMIFWGVLGLVQLLIERFIYQ